MERRKKREERRSKGEKQKEKSRFNLEIFSVSVLSPLHLRQRERPKTIERQIFGATQAVVSAGGGRECGCEGRMQTQCFVASRDGGRSGAQSSGATRPHAHALSLTACSFLALQSSRP